MHKKRLIMVKAFSYNHKNGSPFSKLTNGCNLKPASKKVFPDCIQSKRIDCLLILFLPGMISCTAKKEPAQAPNIICIVCEDISSLLGCYGDKVALTPNLDKLASEGVRFTNMFSVAGVCAPSRNSLITGMYPSGIGGNNMRTSETRRVANMPDSLQIPPYECTPPPFVKCYTEFLRASGYYCTNNEKEDYQFKSPRAAWDESSRYATWKNRPKGAPFFAIFNLMRTHESQVNVWLDEPEIIHPDSVFVPPYYPDTYEIRRDIARVYSNITIMDREVGELIAELEKENLLDQTIIIFYSDHGGPLPRGKREILDTGLKVPFIIRFPGKEEDGTVVNDLCSFVDVPATILSLAGVKIPEYMDGQAFWGEQKSPPREYVFAARDRMDEWFDCRRAVRDTRFKYIRNYRPEFGAYLDISFRKQLKTMQVLLEMRDAGTLNEDQKYWFRTSKEPEELYDIEKDPYELRNLAADPSFASDLERMRKVHEQWVRKIDDKGVKHFTEKELLWEMWPDGIQPETLSPEIKQDEGLAKISSATEGASIVYQINHKGLNTKHWQLYSQPIALVSGDTVTAIAHRIGFKESKVSELVYQK